MVGHSFPSCLGFLSKVPRVVSPSWLTLVCTSFHFQPLQHKSSYQLALAHTKKQRGVSTPVPWGQMIYMPMNRKGLRPQVGETLSEQNMGNQATHCNFCLSSISTRMWSFLMLTLNPCKHSLDMLQKL